ncbi:ArnT family glycosyltransferase [Streptomyces sp. NPDC059740]|uniref:ArnT family glycosyltransferase n=1 Tax=Streptomyces sp. NPDC059740 TaxID=3346926 RepID=UPI00364C24D3
MPTHLPAAPAPAPGRSAAWARTADRRRYWGRLLPSLAALAVVTRLPSFRRPVWNPDEGYLATQARILAAGGRLYTTVVDRKPPLLPWLYRACFAVFGDRSLWPVRVLALLAGLATAVLLAHLARRRHGERAGWVAGVLALTASVGLNPQDAQAALFEVFMLPWAVAAFVCADHRRWGAAGLCAAAAALTRQTGAVALLPVACLLLRTVPGLAPRTAAAGRVAAGFALPLLAAAASTSPAGFLFWTVSGSGTYLFSTAGLAVALGRAAGNAALLAAGSAGLLWPALRRPRAAPAEVRWWLGGALLGVTLGLHFFGHYYLELVPPLVLLAAAALSRLPARTATTALVLGGVSCTAFLTWGLLTQPSWLRHSEEVAHAVRARTAPGEAVWLWGMHPEQYWLADRPPATRFLTAGLLTNHAGGRPAATVGAAYGVPGSWDVLRAELRTHPPRLVVDDSLGQAYGPRRVPELRHLLRGYHRVGSVGGAVLYALTPEEGQADRGHSKAP